MQEDPGKVITIWPRFKDCEIGPLGSVARTLVLYAFLDIQDLGSTQAMGIDGITHISCAFTICWVFLLLLKSLSWLWVVLNDLFFL